MSSEKVLSPGGEGLSGGWVGGINPISQARFGTNPISRQNWIPQDHSSATMFSPVLLATNSGKSMYNFPCVLRHYLWICKYLISTTIVREH